ncbi:hypothetical protein [Phenylobacterium zucineum]|uniref:hypothetical protein n=1 Tax=Phenylobacterium zucineum TaxID=284016 RepID=UPI0002D8CD90|nr:hypothetical protein [Phenylobacterium zucineum]
MSLALHAQPALVAKAAAGKDAADTYLVMGPLGQADWVADPEAATAFASMREATRAALRLPAALRAFGLPREPEVALRRAH